MPKTQNEPLVPAYLGHDNLPLSAMLMKEIPCVSGHRTHTYSVCDRRFGTKQTLFKKHEIIAIPRQWATVLEESNLSNVEVSWVTLAMIKDFKNIAASMQGKHRLG